MKILHVADLHNVQDWFAWVRDASPNYDLLVIAGDLQNMFSNIPPAVQEAGIRSWVSSLKTPILLCGGNHETEPLTCRTVGGSDLSLSDISQVIGIDGDRVEIEGLRFECIGWRRQPQGPADFYVVHAPPEGAHTALTDHGTDIGDCNLRSHLDQFGGVALCGHIHTPQCVYDLRPGRCSLNPGFGDGAAVPNHWVIDTKRQVADWFGPGASLRIQLP